MTEEQVLKFIADWQKCLSLEPWGITVRCVDEEVLNLSDDSDEGIRATVETHQPALRARVRIATDHDEETVKSDAVHELVHIVLSPMIDIMRETAGQLSPQSREIVCELLKTAEDQAVTKLTQALMADEVA